MPPTRMIPLIAFVTLMSGVCSAGVTFHTTCHPTTHASRNTVRCSHELRGRDEHGRSSTSAARRPPQSAVDTRARAVAHDGSFTGTGFFTSGCGAPSSAQPRLLRRRPHQLAVEQHERAALASRPRGRRATLAARFSSTTSATQVVDRRARRARSTGSPCGCGTNSVRPMIVTPNFSTILSRSVSAQLPPCSAARSTMSEPVLHR